MTAAARALFGAMRLCRNRKLHKLRSGSHAFMPADLCELLDHTVTALPLAAHLHSVDKRAHCALGVTDMRSEPRLIETDTTRAFGRQAFGDIFEVGRLFVRNARAAPTLGKPLTRFGIATAVGFASD